MGKDAQAQAAAVDHSPPPEFDELTGLRTRRAFFALAEPAFDAAAKRKSECTAVIVDLDRLALVNRKHGYEAGNELIHEAAAAMSAIASEGDILGRLGGDEFVFLRPAGVDSPDELRAEIGDAIAEASRSDRPYGLAVSVGIVSMRASEVDSLDAFLSRADAAMYLHKVAGGGEEGRPHVRLNRRD
jgi:diguanylate cyclase